MTSHFLLRNVRLLLLSIDGFYVKLTMIFAIIHVWVCETTRRHVCVYSSRWEVCMGMAWVCVRVCVYVHRCLCADCWQSDSLTCRMWRQVLSYLVLVLAILQDTHVRHLIRWHSDMKTKFTWAGFICAFKRINLHFVVIAAVGCFPSLATHVPLNIHTHTRTQSDARQRSSC